MVNAKRVFEFGTFCGSNTYNVALNLPEDGEVFTLDLEPACIAWHDYQNEEHPAVTKYLAGLSRYMPLVAIEDTRLCFWFSSEEQRACLARTA